MQKKIDIFMTIALCMGVLPILGIVYFLYSYLSQPSTPYDPLREECLVGVEMIHVYTWPLWVGVIGFGIGFRNQIKPILLILSGLSVFLVVTSYILTKVI